MLRVLFTAPFPEPLMARIRAVSPDVEVEQHPFPEGKWPEGLQTAAEVYYAINVLPPPEMAPELRWVQAHWAGVDHIRDHPLWQADVRLTTASGIHAPNLAQYTLAQMLAWAHRVPQWLKHQRAGTWPGQRWKKFVPTELRGTTLGILGYGSLGREIARLARSFGMRILVTKRDLAHIEDRGFQLPGVGDPSGSLPDRYFPPEQAAAMVRECDFVVVTLPLTKATYHLVNEELLRQMKANCYLINIGRGSLVDEKALVKALKKKWIAGAGLDVFEKEPLPGSSPLWRMKNVLLTPHVGGFTPHYDERATELFCQNLRRYLDGAPLLNLVNRQEEY